MQQGPLFKLLPKLRKDVGPIIWDAIPVNSRLVHESLDLIYFGCMNSKYSGEHIEAAFVHWIFSYNLLLLRHSD
jgi:hypothetical protein